ncbi:MAG: arylsulfatase [Burkholderiaceae bacterium]|nr:arylsulfatase [Burkholderiaceae bacterium]
MRAEPVQPGLHARPDAHGRPGLRTPGPDKRTPGPDLPGPGKRSGLLLASLAAWLLALAACDGALAASPARPNIVLLLADDWGFSDVGAFGSEIATPHLDELAHRGMRFSNFHVSASCSPTRAMLLTGVDNHLNGVGNMRETIPRAHAGRPGYLSVLNTRVVTVATLLRDSGYRTYAAGKWHVGKEPHNLPDQRGFERSLVQGDSGSDNWQSAKRYLDLNDRVDWFEDGKPAVMPADYYSSSFFIDKTIEYIGAGARQDKPFFAYVAFQANHIPLQAPRAFIDKYKGRYQAGWSALRQARRDKAIALGLIPPDTPMASMASTEAWAALSEADKAYQARRMEVYAAMADAMDDQVGRLVAHLKRIGEYENTVFVFLSDNGAEASDPYAMLAGRLWLDWQYSREFDRLGAKGAYTVIGPSWASAAVSPLSTYKFYLGEGGIRVPLIVAGVPGMPAGKIHHGFTHVNDVLPTLLELAGVPRPGTAYQGQRIEAPSGASLLAVLKGESSQVHPPQRPFGFELSGNQALFKGDLKLIRNIPPVGDGQWHLYDIRRDPGETHDLRLKLPEEFRAMQADYAEYARSHGVLPMPDGYDPVQQVLINSLVNVYVPRFGPAALALLAGLSALALLLYRRRRLRHR